MLAFVVPYQLQVALTVAPEFKLKIALEDASILLSLMLSVLPEFTVFPVPYSSA